MNNEKYFNVIKKGNKRAEIYIFGEISSENSRFNDSDISAVSFKKELDALGDVKQIDVHINSPGGAVFEGVAIHNMLKNHNAKIIAYIDGLAASISSVIAMAATEIHMVSNSLMMIHNAWGVFAGDYKELSKSVEVLKQINQSVVNSYLSRDLNVSKEQVMKMMDDETWMNAETGIAYGFADKKTAPIQVAASASKEVLNRYRNVPAAVLKNVQSKPGSISNKNYQSSKETSGVIEALMNL